MAKIVGNAAPLSVTTSSSRTPLFGSAALGPVALIANDGGSDVYFAFGSSSVNAAVTDTPLSAGESITVDVPAGATHIAAITATGSTTLHITQFTDYPQMSGGSSGIVNHSTTGGTDNRKTVTAAGTAEKLVAVSTPAKWVDIQALPGNTGKIAVGFTASVLATGNYRGKILDAGQSVLWPLSDLFSVYVNSAVNGEGVTFVAGTGT